MNIDFNFNEETYVNYPEKFGDLQRHRFMEICNTILYSNDERKIQKAYDLIFTFYRRQIIESDQSVCVSVFEDVILKILNDADNGLYEKYGVQNSPFLRFVALVKEQEDRLYNLNNRRQIGVVKQIIKKDFRLILKSYLLMFIDGHKNQIRNNYIRRLIHLYFSSLIEN